MAGDNLPSRVSVLESRFDAMTATQKKTEARVDAIYEMLLQAKGMRNLMSILLSAVIIFGGPGDKLWNSLKALAAVVR